MRLKLVGLAFGSCFGFLLGWGRLTEYDTIHDMLLFKEPYLFLLMGSGVATAAVLARVLRALGARSVLEGAPITWTTGKPNASTVLGSVLFGIGWALTCTCPGPATAQIGRGQWGGVLTVAGLVAGVALRAWLVSRSAERPPAPGGGPLTLVAGDSMEL